MDNSNTKIANRDLEKPIFDGFSQERFFPLENYLFDEALQGRRLDKNMVIDELLSANINELTARYRQHKN